MFNLQNYNSTDHRRRQSFLLYCAAFCFFLLNVGATLAQTTTFTYQGRFTDSTVVQPTNGVYNMSFKLFGAAAGALLYLFRQRRYGA